MFIEERHKCILESLEQDGKIFVKDLSDNKTILLISTLFLE
ncbi:hypothetical protein [Clostridium sp. IBUN62F]|nr:hypothetical protein [Clostridium sp. IBUN62F]